MRFKKTACYSVLAIYFIATTGDSIIKQIPIEYDDAIVPIFASMTSGTSTFLSANFGS